MARGRTDSRLTEDLVDGAVGGEGAVEDGEVSLEALRDVVATPARVDHRRHKLDVNDLDEVSWLVDAVHAVRLHTLARDLVGHLRGQGGSGRVRMVQLRGQDGS